MGVDLEAEAGIPVDSPIKGKVEHIGPAYKAPNAYGGGYQAVHIPALLINENEEGVATLLILSDDSAVG